MRPRSLGFADRRCAAPLVRCTVRAIPGAGAGFADAGIQGCLRVRQRSRFVAGAYCGGDARAGERAQAERPGRSSATDVRDVARSSTACCRHAQVRGQHRQRAASWVAALYLLSARSPLGGACTIDTAGRADASRPGRTNRRPLIPYGARLTSLPRLTAAHSSGGGREWRAPGSAPAAPPLPLPGRLQEAGAPLGDRAGWRPGSGWRSRSPI